MTDRYILERFLHAQASVYEEACAELKRGSKTGHWMWYIFPQIAGLGSSVTTRRFAISSLDEATAYLRHRLLGPRLVYCTSLVLDVQGQSARAIFGHPDDMKFRSCMTLFAQVPDTNPVFDQAIEAYFGGTYDPLTLDLLAKGETHGSQ